MGYCQFGSSQPEAHSLPKAVLKGDASVFYLPDQAADQLRTVTFCSLMGKKHFLGSTVFLKDFGHVGQTKAQEEKPYSLAYRGVPP